MTATRVRPDCTVEGCGKPHAARGMCRPHYYRQRRQEKHLAKVCPTCGANLPAVQSDSGGRPRKYCTEQCRKLARVGRPTQYKGKHVPFTSDNLDTFWSRTVVGPDCWEWTAGKNSDGYGYFSVDGYAARAHRWIYEATVAPIPEGLTIDHLCRNRACVRTDHFEVVTVAENSRRARAHHIDDPCTHIPDPEEWL